MGKDDKNFKSAGPRKSCTTNNSVLQLLRSSFANFEPLGLLFLKMTCGFLKKIVMTKVRRTLGDSRRVESVKD